MSGVPVAVSADERAVAAAAYASPTSAYERGAAALQSGNADEARLALEYAASKGVLNARIRLAELYAAGDTLPKDEVKSFAYYQGIANDFADVSPRHPVARQVAKAFVALARFQLDGVAAAGVKPDPVRAAHLYRHAASYFGDPDAQYHLARLYLDGIGVNRNVRLGVGWLANAAMKQHAKSQATLGDMLWRDTVESYHQPLKGLALLRLARENAIGTVDEKWITELYQRASAQAQPEQRERAARLASRWTRGSAGGEASASDILPREDETLTTSQSPATGLLAEISPAESGVRNVGAVEPASRTD